MTVFLTSPWIPAEWIRAHGLASRGIWAAEPFPAGALPLSAGVCAFAETAVRIAETQPDSAVVFSTACDQMRRGFDTAMRPGSRRAFLFNLPTTGQPAVAKAMFRAELERLGKFLQQLGGSAPTPETLWREMLQADDFRRRLCEAAPLASARSFAEAVARFHAAGEFIAPSISPPGNPVLLALIGGPLPEADWKLFDAIEAAGGRIVLNATKTGERSLCPSPWRQASLPAVAPGFQPGGKDSANPNVPNPMLASADPSVYSGRQGCRPLRQAGMPDATNENALAADPFDALVTGYFENLVDVFQRPNTRLYSWLQPRLAARQVRGIVLWHFTGCDLWRAEAATLRETFGLPVLLLEASGEAGNVPREQTRLQAFVEMLQ